MNDKTITLAEAFADELACMEEDSITPAEAEDALRSAALRVALLEAREWSDWYPGFEPECEVNDIGGVSCYGHDSLNSVELAWVEYRIKTLLGL